MSAIATTYAGSPVVAAEHRAHLAALAAKVERLRADLLVAERAGLEREAYHIGLNLADHERLHDAAAKCLERHGILPDSRPSLSMMTKE